MGVATLSLLHRRRRRHRWARQRIAPVIRLLQATRHRRMHPVSRRSLPPHPPRRPHHSTRRTPRTIRRLLGYSTTTRIGSLHHRPSCVRSTQMKSPIFASWRTLTIRFGKSPRQGGTPTLAAELLNLHPPPGQVCQARMITRISHLNGTIDRPCRHPRSRTEVPHPAPLVRRPRAIASTRPTGKLRHREVTGMARDPVG